MRFYMIAGAVILTLAALSNLAFGFGLDLFDHHHGRHW